MKQIINNKLYDTDTAESLGSCAKGSTQNWNGYEFYRTTKGNLFKERLFWRCKASGSTNNLSETNEKEMYELLIEYDAPMDLINILCPNILIDVA